MHDVYTARLFCWQPTSGILTGGIVVGQDIAIRIAESHALGQRLGEILYIDRQMVPICPATSLGGVLSRTRARK